METILDRSLRKAELELGLINMAKEFALDMHGAQRHGSLTISDHLNMVVGKAIQEYDHAFPLRGCGQVELIQAAWLHDVLEDTTATYPELVEHFGICVADMVQAVTDGPGLNRQERHLNTYYRTRQNRGATFVKLCDRWHNQHRSLAHKEVRFASEYAREYTYFKFALYERPLFASFWKQMDEQHSAALKFLSSPTDPILPDFMPPMNAAKYKKEPVQELQACVSANPTSTF